MRPYFYFLLENKKSTSLFHDPNTFQFAYYLLRNVKHGPLTRYANLRVAHAPGMPGTFSLPPTSMGTSSYRSRHASRHARHARALMHAGSLTCGGGENNPGIPGACATRIFAYLVRGPCTTCRASATGNNIQEFWSVHLGSAFASCDIYFLNKMEYITKSNVHTNIPHYLIIMF